MLLELQVNLTDDSITTFLHIKPNNNHHQHLLFLSSLPNGTKRSLIYSQTLRIGSICSIKGDFNWHAIEMKAWFADIRYPD